jgi:hypothetical protein
LSLCCTSSPLSFSFFLSFLPSPSYGPCEVVGSAGSRLASREAAHETSLAQEPQETDEADNGQDGGRVQQELEEVGGTFGRGLSDAKRVEVVAGNHNDKQNVGKEPRNDQTGTERLVRVLQVLGLGNLLLVERSQGAAHSLLKLAAER